MNAGMVFLAILPGKGQDLSLCVTPTFNDLFLHRGLDGGSIVHLKAGVSSSFQCDFIGERRVYTGAGLCYQFGQLEISPSPDPTVSHDTRVEIAHLLTVNLRLALKLGKDYHLSADPLLDFQLNQGEPDATENQTGLGLSFGCGKKILLGDYLFLMIEPRLWIHNLVPFSGEVSPARLATGGLNLGLGARLNN